MTLRWGHLPCLLLLYWIRAPLVFIYYYFFFWIVHQRWVNLIQCITSTSNLMVAHQPAAAAAEDPGPDTHVHHVGARWSNGSETTVFCKSWEIFTRIISMIISGCLTLTIFNFDFFLFMNFRLILTSKKVCIEKGFRASFNQTNFWSYHNFIQTNCVFFELNYKLKLWNSVLIRAESIFYQMKNEYH